MHLKFFREQKNAAKDRLADRDFDVMNDDDWNDFMQANGYIRPCKLRRKFNKLIEWTIFWILFFIIGICGYLFFSSISQIEALIVLIILGFIYFHILE